MSKFCVCVNGHRWEAEESVPGRTARANVCPVCSSGEETSLQDLAALPTWEESDEMPPPACPLPEAVARVAARLLVAPERAGPAGLPVVAGYEIVGLLGRGGMGLVYQARELKRGRSVALKMIMGGAHAEPRDLARFRAEAEAVARLHHPHIVQIYEVGEQDGWAYCALELVAGGSLARHFAGRPQEAGPSAEFVETIARTADYAHEHGIVHRDLKPANVLLAADGTPKITDFGLAKRLGSDPGTSALLGLTRSGEILGTPSYMAPEQTLGRPEIVGPAADVYALGAILYESLTGRPPFHAATALDTLLQVRGQEPVPPRRLVPAVPRDLDTICLKCLQKEPDRRYVSAGALADDLRRFLDGKSVQARRPAAWRRGLKWARRRPALATALAAPFVALVGLVGGLLWHDAGLRVALEEKQQEHERAETHRQKAEVNAALAREQGNLALGTLKTVVFEIQRELEDKPGLHRLREKLLRNAIAGLERLSQPGEGDNSEAHHSMIAALLDVGDIFLEVGRSDDAHRHYERAHRIALARVAAFPDLAQAQWELSQSYDKVGDATFRLGRTTAARDFYRKSLDIRQALAKAAPDDREIKIGLAAAYGNLGRLSLELGEIPAARAYHLQALELRQALARDDLGSNEAKRELASVYKDLGEVSADLGKPTEARDYYLRGLELIETLASAEADNTRARREVLAFYGHLGDVTLTLGKTEAAKGYFLKGIKEAEILAALDRSNTEAQRQLGEFHGRLGDVHLELGELQAARDDYLKATELVSAAVTADPNNARARQQRTTFYGDLGDVSQQLDALDEAANYYSEGLKLAEADAAADRGNAEKQRILPMFYTHLGEVSAKLADIPRAAVYYRKGLELAQTQATADRDNPEAAWSVAFLYFRLGELDQECFAYGNALESYQRAWPILQRLAAEGKVLGQPRDAQLLRTVEKHIALCRAAPRALDDLDFALKQPFDIARPLLAARVAALARCGRHVEAAATADKLCGLIPKKPFILYSTACAYAQCIFAVTVPKPADHLTAAERMACERYAAAAVDLLREAIRAGYRDKRTLRKNPDLEPLRQREDFQTLVRDLEGRD
jgi:tetratricopeptide (TPR) repeat protein